MVKRIAATAPNRPPRELLTKLHSLKGERGKIAVIEPDSGEYFLGNTLTEVLQRARRKFPGKVFYSIRIGFDYVHEHKGGFKSARAPTSGAR